MGKKRSLFEINGVEYMSPGVAHDKWDLSTQSITAACKNGRIEGACKDSSDRWIIPVYARKPMDREEIRQIMIGLLSLKNRPIGKIELQNDKFDKILDYMKEISCIEDYDIYSDEFPYNVVLTDKGMQYATEGPESKIDWCTIVNTLVTLTSTVLRAWQS